MPSESITREIFWNVPLWAKVLLYALTVLAFGTFACGVWQRARAWRVGRSAPDRVPIGSVLRRLVRNAVLHVRIWRSPFAGVAHAGVFWGFVVLFIGTCIVAVEEYGSALFGARPLFFYGGFYLTVSAALDVFGLVFLAGLAAAASRRGRGGARRPLARGIDMAVLWLLVVIGLSGFLLEGLRIAGADGGRAASDFERWSFVGWWIAALCEELPGDVIAALHLSVWLVHAVLSLAFVAVIPYCKLRHIVFAPVHVALARDPAPGRLTSVSLEEVEETGRYGAGRPADFTRRQLFSFDACTECGRCQDACPAYSTSKPLSPMGIVRDVAQAAGEAARSKDPVPAEAAPLPGERISTAALWACTTCGACVSECPVSIDPLGAVVEMRRHLVGEGQVRGGAQAALRSIAAQGNPWGLPAEERMSWAEGLDVPTLETEPKPEILLWVGCAGALDRAARRTTRAVVRILEKAGVRYAVLGKKERCTGDPARRLGDEFTYLEAASANVELLRSSGVRRVVTACPHCFSSLRNEYREQGLELEVLHHTQLIDELLASGRLRLSAGREQRVAFHDPCYLGRQGGEFDAPRRALEAAGAEVLEPDATREDSFCCGAGGGRMWMEEDTEQRVSDARWQQLEARRPDAVAVACPFCRTMMTDAAAGRSSDVKVVDVAEVVADRLESEDSPQ